MKKMTKKKITSKPYKITPIRYCMVMILTHQGRSSLYKVRKAFKMLLSKYGVDRRKRITEIVKCNKLYGLNNSIERGD